MSKRSKHQKAEFPAGKIDYSAECMNDCHEPGCRCGWGRTDVKPGVEIPVSNEAGERGLASLTYVYHDNEQDNGNAVRYAMGLPPYSPLTQDEFVPTRVCTRREHELLQGRISNQRRELKNLNRAYRRRADKHSAQVVRLRDSRTQLLRTVEERNGQIQDLRSEIDELRRQLAIAQNGGRRRRGFRWGGK